MVPKIQNIFPFLLSGQKGELELSVDSLRFLSKLKNNLTAFKISRMWSNIFFHNQIMLQRICYSHWANGDRNGVISIGQCGVFNHEKGAI